jgi:hypothetical protein
MSAKRESEAGGPDPQPSNDSSVIDHLVKGMRGAGGEERRTMRERSRDVYENVRRIWQPRRRMGRAAD